MPGLTARERKRLLRLERTLARAERGSHRRGRVKLAIAAWLSRVTAPARGTEAGPPLSGRWSAEGGVHFPDEDLGRFCRGDLLSAGGGEAYRVAGRERPGSLQGDAAAGDEQVQVGRLG